MKKIFIGLMILCMVPLCLGQRTSKSLTDVPQIDGSVLHTIQSGWAIAESENSGDTQTDALGVAELTKVRLDAVIAANASNEEFISYFLIPAKWNGMRFRAVGISDNGTVIHQIYFGRLGDDVDCEFTYVGQLSWVIGQQKSIYDQITFTSGGTVVPRVDDIVTGNTSGKTATIVAISDLSSGTWAAGTAAGTITYKSASGTFGSGETISIRRGTTNITLDGFTHAGSDLIDFELAHECTTTAKSWNSAWTTISPSGEMVAEAKIDVLGSDIMVIVSTATVSADAKLLVTGY